MKLLPTGKNGIYSELAGISADPIHGVHMTIPAKEALEMEGHGVVKEGDSYAVTLKGRRIPKGLVAAIRMRKADSGYGMIEEIVLRLDVEPEWPGESANKNWLTAEWLGCPECGAPVVWYEAGYVPGYRVCTGKKHHHSIVKF